MTNVIVQGVFMGANLKTSSFEGKEKTNLYIDVYQPDSDDNEKTVQIKSDDLGLLGVFSKEYSMGSIFNAKCSVNAYKNKAYYKLKQIIEA